jgi:hypothetical protein
MEGMQLLDRLLPAARLIERDEIDLAAEPTRVLHVARRLDLGSIPLVKALFAVRTWFSRAGADDLRLGLDAMVSTPEHPGFQVLAEDGDELAVGAIGKVWHLDIPFVHVASAEEFARFAEPDQVKVAWSLHVEPRGDHDARLVVEVRVDATDDAAWQKFRTYFRLIGPASRLIRRVMLQHLARELGTPESVENARPLPGDELLPDALAQLTHGVTIDAAAEAVWPWLVQMGCHRGGFYSVDWLDNGGVESAREVHPELQRLAVGDVLPASPSSSAGFEVLQLDAPRSLVLGGLFDGDAGEQLPFGAPRPPRFWHVTWTFALERLDQGHTRLHVRARAAAPRGARLHLAAVSLAHRFMETMQLRHLKERVEGRPHADVRGVIHGVEGAARIAAALATPFLREPRSHWGLGEEEAAQLHPGDHLIPQPQWAWTHAVVVEAPAHEVWPWIAQIGRDRGGFYSYTWLENLVGCGVHDAEAIHPEWQARPGDQLVLHPRQPPMTLVRVEPGRLLVAHAEADPVARARGEPWAEASWLFAVEPLDAGRCRLLSRYRCAFSDDAATRVAMGPTVLQPVSFVMDRRMLLGVKQRAESRRSEKVFSGAARRCSPARPARTGSSS